MRGAKIIFYISTVFFIVTSYRQIFFNTSLHYDETGNYLPVWNYTHHKQYAFTIQNPDILNPTSAFITIGPYVVYSLTLFSTGIGTEWYWARLWIVLHAVVLLWIIYLFVKNYFSRPVALLTCAILMFNSTFIVYSTRIMGEIPALLGCFFGFWAYWQGKEKKRVYWYILAFAGFEISILSKEYFAVLIGMTLLLTWIFQEKCYPDATFWIGLFLPLGIMMWYYFHFRNWETMQVYFKERQIYHIEFFAWKHDALQWIVLKFLIWAGYILHSIKCYLQKKRTDIFLWIFQTVYLVLFLVSIGFERFGMGLSIVSGIYMAEFLYGLHKIPALTERHKALIFIIFAVLLIQKSPYLLWKKTKQMPVFNVQCHENTVIHTPELSLIPSIVKCRYQLPLFPPAKLKFSNNTENTVQILQKQYLSADILILGEYAFTEYTNIYDKKTMENYFEKREVKDAYEMWIKKSVKNTL